MFDVCIVSILDLFPNLFRTVFGIAVRSDNGYDFRIMVNFENGVKENLMERVPVCRFVFPRFGFG